MTPGTSADPPPPQIETPILLDCTVWFSVVSVIAYVWLRFIQRGTRVTVVEDEEPEPPPMEPADRREEP